MKKIYWITEQLLKIFKWSSLILSAVPVYKGKFLKPILLEETQGSYITLVRGLWSSEVFLD